MNRRHVWSACPLLVAMVLAGCGVGNPPDVSSVGVVPSQGAANSGTLVVGSSPSVRPLEYLDEKNEVTGLVIDLIRAVAVKMDTQVKFETMSFDALIPALQSKRINMITQMGDLPERRGTVTFIDFLQSGAALLVADGNPRAVKGPNDLCGLRVAFSRGTSQQKVTEAAAAWCASNGKKEVQQAAYPGATETVLALRSGQADAAWTDVVNAAFLMKQTPGTYAVAYKDNGHGYGIGFPKQDVELRERFFKELQTLREDGTYKKLVEKYGLEDSILKEFTINQGQGLDIPVQPSTTTSR